MSTKLNELKQLRHITVRDLFALTEEIAELEDQHNRLSKELDEIDYRIMCEIEEQI